jgi:hypothetical protein
MARTVQAWVHPNGLPTIRPSDAESVNPTRFIVPNTATLGAESGRISGLRGTGPSGSPHYARDSIGTTGRPAHAHSGSAVSCSPLAQAAGQKVRCDRGTPFGHSERVLLAHSRNEHINRSKRTLRTRNRRLEMGDDRACRQQSGTPWEHQPGCGFRFEDQLDGP